MNKIEVRARQKARKIALQAGYQWLMSSGDLSEIEAQYCMANNMEKVDKGLFSDLLHGSSRHIVEIEKTIEPFLDRKVSELNPVERTALRLGAYELLFSLEIPYRIILDEWVTLTRKFGSQDGFKYVNGVLDNLASQIRTIEYNQEKK